MKELISLLYCLYNKGIAGFLFCGTSIRRFIILRRFIMEQLVKIIIKRLKEKGMDITLVPSFVRDVANLSISSASDLKELNRRLETLGWYEYELDDHTFQLIEAVIEKECFTNRVDVEEGVISKVCAIPQLFKQVSYSHAF
jgi:hypothetical protein